MSAARESGPDAAPDAAPGAARGGAVTGGAADANDGGGTLALAGRTLRLHRFPDRGPTSLRAWSHGEERLLQLPLPDGPLLLCSDGYGALVLGTAGVERVLVADRATTRHGLAANAERNADVVAPDDIAAVPVVTALAIPAHAPSGRPFAAVWIAWPRAHDEGFELLARLGAALPAGTPVAIAARAEDWSARIVTRIASTLQDAVVGRAVRRGRSIEGRLRTSRPPEAKTVMGPDDLRLKSHAGVFAHGHVDVGTARLLPFVPTRPPAARILDLGCGNGVLGVVAALRQPGSEVIFCDDSALALDATQRTWQANLGRLAGRTMQLLHDSHLRSLADASIDLVLCNPPMHIGKDMSRQTAAGMFRDAARVLRPDGALYVVANRHLDYEPRLVQDFATVSAICNDPRFVVWRARQPRPRSRGWFD